jgi:hypothetical protein
MTNSAILAFVDSRYTANTKKGPVVDRTTTVFIREAIVNAENVVIGASAEVSRLLTLLYAHGEMYGLVTVTQGSPYVSNAVTHPRYMCWRANFSEVAQISPKFGFPGDCVHE